MIFLDELKDKFLYKRPFLIPINEKDKRKGSSIFLLSPNVDTSIKMMNMNYVLNKRLFESYYLEKDVSFILNQSGTISERFDNDSGVGFVTEESLSSQERKELKASDFGLPDKRKYPMHDEEHVLSAIRFFNYVKADDEKELALNIIKKVKEFDMKDIKIGSNNRLRKFIDPSESEFSPWFSESFILEMEEEKNPVREEAHKIFNDFINKEQIKPEYNKGDVMLDAMYNELFWPKLANFIEQNKDNIELLKVAKKKLIKYRDDAPDEKEVEKNKRGRFMDFSDIQIKKINKWIEEYKESEEEEEESYDESAIQEGRFDYKKKRPVEYNVDLNKELYPVYVVLFSNDTDFGKMIRTFVIGNDYLEAVSKIIPFCKEKTDIIPFVGKDKYHLI